MFPPKTEEPPDATLLLSVAWLWDLLTGGWNSNFFFGVTGVVVVLGGGNGIPLKDIAIRGLAGDLGVVG